MQKFNNDIYLTERTKLLEGVLCQSITFTNYLSSNDYLNAEQSALSYFSKSNGADEGTTQFFSNLYKNPLKINDSITAISINDLWESYRSAENLEGFSLTNASAKIVCDGVTTNLSLDQSVELYPKSSLQISYEFEYRYTSSPLGSDIDISVIYTFSVLQNQYPLKPYTITDCICRCLELAEPLLFGETPRYTLQGVTYSFDAEGQTLVRDIAEGSQAAKYNKIFAPDFSMTQCTLREQLKIIGGYIHAEPRLGYDPDGTGLNYEENTIFFEEYGQETETNLGENGYIYRGIAQSLNDYCTNVTTDVANVVNTLNNSDGVITDPGKGVSRTLRTESINIMLTQTEGNAEIYTQFPVYSIEKVECGIFDPNGAELVPLKDITPYIFEAHAYNSILSSYGGAYPYSKSYALYYTQGQRNIKGLFFKADEGGSGNIDYLKNFAITNILTAVTGANQKDNITNYWDGLTFRVTYTPIYSSKFSHGKSEMQEGNHQYTAIYSQAENLIETTYYGENIKGVAERMGNAQETRTYILPNASLIPKTGQRLGEFVITSVSSQYFHNYVACTVSLTKRFNRISQYVGIKSQKRISEVSEREAYARNILLKEYVVIGTKVPDTAKLIKDRRVLASSLVGGFTDKSPITMAVCGGTPKRYWEGPERDKNPVYPYGAVALPVVSSAFGNVMVFSWDYKDNYSAGTQLGKTNGANWVMDIPYSDYYGRFYWYDFSLTSDASVENQKAFADKPTSRANVFGFPQKTPNAPIRTSFVEQNVAKYHNPVLVRKDSREVLNFNYALEYITNREDLIIGSAIASKCTLVGTDMEHRTAKVYFFENHRFGKYPKTLAEVQEQAIYVLSIGQGNINEDLDNFDFSIPVIVDFSSWCIAYEPITITQLYSDEDGNTVEYPLTTGGEIVLACNNDVQYYREKGITTETIFISTTNSNLKGA